MTTRKLQSLAIFFLFAICPAWAQSHGQIVDVSPFSPRSSPNLQFFYDGASPPNLIYVCETTPIGPWGPNGSTPSTFSWTRAAATLTSIVVSSNVGTVTTSTAHGLQVGNPFVVTGSTTSALNGTYYIVTVPTTTTFTIATSMVNDGTYNNAAMVGTTSAPRSTVAIWSIKRLIYNAGNSLIAIQYADGNSGSYTHICDSRATYTYR